MSFSFPTQNPFTLWETKLNPHWWFYQEYHKRCHDITDNREYTDELISYLIKNGAQVIESSVVINNEDDRDSEDEFMPWRGGGSQTNFWFKGYWISISGDTDERSLNIYHLPEATPDLAEFSRFLRPLEKGSVSVLLQGDTGRMYTKELDFKPPVIDDLELNYGTGFNKHHQAIVEKLNRRCAGLFLLHGSTGSGKSFYIKHLTSVVDREFIFIPISMVGSLSSPQFIKVLLEHEEAVLVLEDAEQALQSREEDIYNSSVVASLLNLSDGILGSLLRCSLVCSFNMDKSNVDSALLRRGRLQYSHEFNKLSISDARRLASHLKRDIRVEEPTSLADIYNASEETGYKEVVKPAIGFGAVTPI